MILQIFLYLVGAMLFVAGVVSFLSYKNQVHKYDYLTVLSYTEWIAGRQVRKLLDEKYGSSINDATLYATLRQLEEEGLVSKRLTEDSNGPVAEFLRKSGGIREVPKVTVVTQLPAPAVI